MNTPLNERAEQGDTQMMSFGDLIARRRAEMWCPLLRVIDARRSSRFEKECSVPKRNLLSRATHDEKKDAFCPQAHGQHVAREFRPLPIRRSFPLMANRVQTPSANPTF